MKRTNKQILGNVILTVVLVGAVCFGLACVKDTETASSGIVTYRTGRVPASSQSVGDRSWLVPNIAQSNFHASSTSRGSAQPAATATASGGHSLISTGLSQGSSAGGGLGNGASYGQRGASSGSATAQVSGGTSFGSIPRQSMAGSTSVSEPFSNPSQRPDARPRPKVDPDGGKDEPFYEPIGGALVPLLLCAAGYTLYVRRRKKANG